MYTLQSACALKRTLDSRHRRRSAHQLYPYITIHTTTQPDGRATLGQFHLDTRKRRRPHIDNHMQTSTTHKPTNRITGYMNNQAKQARKDPGKVLSGLDNPSSPRKNRTRMRHKSRSVSLVPYPWLRYCPMVSHPSDPACAFAKTHA